MTTSAPSLARPPAPSTPVGSAGPGEGAGLTLDVQLDAQAQEHDSWLRARIAGRYGGLERDGDGFWALVWVTPKRPGDTDLRGHWFGGASPVAALARARAWVEEHLSRRAS